MDIVIYLARVYFRFSKYGGRATLPVIRIPLRPSPRAFGGLMSQGITRLLRFTDQGGFHRRGYYSDPFTIAPPAGAVNPRTQGRSPFTHVICWPTLGLRRAS